MSSVYYSELLWWSSHQHRGIAKSHGHQMQVNVPPVICGHHVEACDFAPEINVATIQEKFGGSRDMTHDEILDAERVLHDLIPET